MCASMRTTRAKALAVHVAQGGRRQDFNEMRRDIFNDVMSWFKAVPGLMHEIQLLAWAHRDERPFIHAVSSSQSDADGSGVHVEMIPRSFWDADPRFLETYPAMLRYQLRLVFGPPSFCPTKQYFVVML